MQSRSHQPEQLASSTFSSTISTIFCDEFVAHTGQSLPACGRLQVISPVTCSGYVEVVDNLAVVQMHTYDRPTILVSRRVSGEEEIPEGCVAVLTPDMPDVLSHVSVRARNEKARPCCGTSPPPPNTHNTLCLRASSHASRSPPLNRSDSAGVTSAFVSAASCSEQCYAPAFRTAPKSA